MTPSTPGFLFESPKTRFRDNPKKKMKKKTDCELVLEFCVELSRLMIVSGANLERVQLAIEYICNAYGYPDFSLYLLNNFISLSVTDSEGAYCSRQSVIAPTVIHLERLKRLNDLSFQAAREKPSPKRLRTMLNEALKVKERPDWQILLGRVLAFSSLGMVVGGDEREILSIAIVVFAMHFIMKAAAKPGLNRLLTNARGLHRVHHEDLRRLLFGILHHRGGDFRHVRGTVRRRSRHSDFRGQGGYSGHSPG